MLNLENILSISSSQGEISKLNLEKQNPKNVKFNRIKNLSDIPFSFFFYSNLGFFFNNQCCFGHPWSCVVSSGECVARQWDSTPCTHCLTPLTCPIVFRSGCLVLPQQCTRGPFLSLLSNIGFCFSVLSQHVQSSSISCGFDPHFYWGNTDKHCFVYWSRDVLPCFMSICHKLESFGKR